MKIVVLTALAMLIGIAMPVMAEGNVKPRALEQAATARAASSSSRLTASVSGTGRRRPLALVRVAQTVVEQRVGDAGKSVGGSMDGIHPALQEVLVTAQKFVERAFDVPMSLAVVEGAQLERLNVTGLDDLRSVVPGLATNDSGYNEYIAIRGISNLSGSGALVGSYIDEADVTTDDAFGLNLATYDLQRVEVLRGPQGTLYGEGSVGGTIRYITNKPNLNDVQMLADVEAMFDQYGAPSDRIVAVVNAPIVQREVGLRIAADVDHEGGWVDQPVLGLKNINGGDIDDVRAEGLWVPAETLAINVTQIIHRETRGPAVGENGNGDFVQVFNQPTVPSLQNFYDISNLTISENLRYVRIVNSATYLNYDNTQKNVGTIIPLLAPPAPVFDEYEPQARVATEVGSDELRASSGLDGAWRWTLGGFYRHYAQRYLPFVYYFALPGPPGTPLPTPFPSSQSARSSSWSGFGDTTYRLFDRFTVGAGFRYFKDDESFIGSGGTIAQTASFTSADPRFYVRYRVSEGVNVYASAAKGFRSGGFNSFGQPPFGPESAWTYGLGLK